MAHFIGNDDVTFDVEKVRIVYWHCCGEDKTTRTEIIFIDGSDLYLYFIADDDYKLINDLREYFGYDPLPRVK